MFTKNCVAFILFHGWSISFCLVSANCPTILLTCAEATMLHSDFLAVSDGVLYTHGPPVLMVVATRLCKLLRPKSGFGRELPQTPKRVQDMLGITTTL